MTHKVGDQVFVAHADKPDACPMPAWIACVNEDKTVNVMALNHLGQPQALSNLSLDKKPGFYHLHAPKAEHRHEAKHEPKHEHKHETKHHPHHHSHR